MRPLVWVMKRKRISRQQTGLSILILILLLGWGINHLLFLQADLGFIGRGNDIFILVTGEVRNPGVYVFNREPSLKELISSAGGLKAKLLDSEGDRYPHLARGARVQISAEKGYMEVLTGSMPATYKVTLKIPISINTASQEELDAIPDIGPCLAEEIIHYRSLYGPFKTAEGIRDVPGIGKLRYSKIRPYIGT